LLALLLIEGRASPLEIVSPGFQLEKLAPGFSAQVAIRSMEKQACSPTGHDPLQQLLFIQGVLESLWLKSFHFWRTTIGNST
jgi:hypothetical protein